MHGAARTIRHLHLCDVATFFLFSLVGVHDALRYVYSMYPACPSISPVLIGDVPLFDHFNGVVLHH